MDVFEKILIGVGVFLLTSVIAYLFRVRQLYAAAVKLYGQSVLSKDGTLAEVVIWNKGKQTEEEIKLEFEPNVKIELVASSINDVTLDSQTISTPRLHKGEKISLMLLVEKSNIEKEDLVRLSSKQAAGTICTTVDSMPPNYASSLIAVCLFLLVLATPIYIASSINPALDKYVAYKNSVLISKGWKNLNKYHWSALRDSYSKSEFPIYFKGLGQEKKGIPNGIFVYSNKTSIPMKISSDTPYKTKITDLTYYGSQVTVDPMSSIEVSVPLAPSLANDREKEVAFGIFWGDEYIYDQSLTINLDALKR